MPFPKPDPERLIQLLQRVALGDEQAFEELYAVSGANLYGVLLRILRRPEWAQEALQDCFLKIWQRSETYLPERGAALTWLMSLARYRALDLLRERQTEPGVQIELSEAEEAAPLKFISPEQTGGAWTPESEGSNRLSDCIQQLREEERQCLLLVYYEGYTHLELAQLLSVPLGTIKSRVRRGLARLRECLRR